MNGVVHRKPRPLCRNNGELRDDRLFILACDDTYAPKQYFDFFRIPRIQVHVIPTKNGSCSAEHVLDRLLEVEHEADDERWLVLDTDHYIKGNHLKSFTSALQKARQSGIEVALSRPCFELWLLLHHLDESTVSALTNAREVESALHKAQGVAYNKTNLKQECYPLSSVPVAYKRAKQLDSRVDGGDIPSGNTTRIYKIWQKMAEKMPRAQLPDELSDLLQ